MLLGGGMALGGESERLGELKVAASFQEKKDGRLY